MSSPSLADREPVTQRECRFQIPVPIGRRQRRLRRPVAAPAQGAPDRQTQLAREIIRLIEPAPQGAQRMEGDRNHGVCFVEHVGAREAHHATQRLGEQAPLVVLEHVNDFAQRAFIPSGATRDLERRWLTLTTRALIFF
jgi:hypothetical protein